MSEKVKEKARTVTAGLFALSRLLQASPSHSASRSILERKPSSIVIVAVVGFIISIVSLSSVYIGEDLSQLGSAEFFLENTVPPMYWIGLILLASPILLVTQLRDDRRIPRYVLLISILLMTCMRAILPVTISKPYVTDVRTYISWMEAWLREGIQLAPAYLTKEELLYYYPNTHPVSFILSYSFLKMGLPIDFFFKWAPFGIYAVDLYLVYLVSKEINGGHAELAALSAFLAALSSMAQVFTLWYSPHLLGSALFLLCLYLVLRMAETKGRRMRMLILWATTSIGILLLILTHALSTVYFVATLSGLFLVEWVLKVVRIGGRVPRISALWPMYTVIGWYVCSTVLYRPKVEEWVIGVYNALKGNLISGEYHAVTFTNFFGMGLIDQISFIIYPSLVLGLAMYGLMQTKGRKLADPVIVKTLGLISLLSALFVFGLAESGLTYPLRVIELTSILCCPLAAKALSELLSSDRSKIVKLCVGVGILAVVLLSTHWMFRGIQKLIY
jgi:hypothetical protein